MIVKPEFDEHNLAGLYMLWSQKCPLDASPPLLPEGYLLKSFSFGDDEKFRALIEIDGESLTNQQWQDYKDKVLPDGLFAIQHVESGSLVATAGAAHNPNPGRYHFPFGGELGYLIVHPDHRGKGLGQLISTHIVKRFLTAGYKSIRVGVKGWRHSAIKTYLKVGFVPFLHDEDLKRRWNRICEQIDWPYTPNDWPEDLHEFASITSRTKALP
jgi:mycothiol synthase